MASAIMKAKRYYGVRRGRKTGVFESWTETFANTGRFSGAEFKAFKCRKDAEFYVENVRRAEAKKTTGKKNSSDLPIRPKDACTTMIYTDGSCKDGVGGYAAICVPKDLSCELIIDKGRVPLSPCTNNQAELYALLMALKMKRPEPFVIVTDSVYALRCARDWGLRFRSNGWKTAANKPVMNVNLISDIIDAQKGLNVNFKHVKGHSGNPYNELADKLAAIGRQQQHK